MEDNEQTANSAAVLDAMVWGHIHQAIGHLEAAKASCVQGGPECEAGYGWVGMQIACGLERLRQIRSEGCMDIYKALPWMSTLDSA